MNLNIVQRALSEYEKHRSTPEEQRRKQEQTLQDLCFTIFTPEGSRDLGGEVHQGFRSLAPTWLTFVKDGSSKEPEFYEAPTLVIDSLRFVARDGDTLALVEAWTDNIFIAFGEFTDIAALGMLLADNPRLIPLPCATPVTCEWCGGDGKNGIACMNCSEEVRDMAKEAIQEERRDRAIARQIYDYD